MNRTTKLIVSAVTLLICCPPLLIVGAIHTPLLRACTWALKLTTDEDNNK